MEIAIGAARWVVGMALGPVTDGVLESWAASSELGANVRPLKMELLYAQGILDNARGHRDDVRSPALAQLLLELGHLAYAAADVLDELDYFRIQDDLEGAYETTDDTDDRGLVGGIVLNARHTARVVARNLRFSLSSPADAEQSERSAPVPKLTFDRVELSKKMADIVEQLKPVCAKVATILNMELLGSAIHNTKLHLPRTTTPEIIEHRLYGRDKLKGEVVDAIARDKRCNNEITVFSVVGPGGIGKTTFTQHVYNEVKEHFVPIWVCVSQIFNASKLSQGIVKQIPKCDNEEQSDSDEELIQKRLRYKQFLLVLDDMWTYHEDEWKKLLAPFKKGGTQGNIVIVTTRIPKVAKMVASKECLIRLERLDDEECMHLFQACVLDNLQSWGDHANLQSVGWDIVKKLKGSPLAVKTVGRLLRNKLTLDHWRKVLESKEWEYQISDDDIMPALKLSYNYLCFDLQQCFSYCALFPEDYEFDSNELINLWIGLGLLSNINQNKRVEDTGSDYLNDLVDQGFLEKGNKEDGQTYYVIHDLLHELAVNVSSNECLSIDGSNVRSIQIPLSVRHLSVIIDTTDVKDRRTFENFKTDLSIVGKRMKAENLRTLMLFGDHHGSFAKILSGLFGKAKSLRVLFLSGVTYNIEDIFPIFSKLVHLRYLRIKGRHIYPATTLPRYISRFYHLLVLDLQQYNSSFVSVREMRNLVKLRHFLVKDDDLHSEILEVGKLVCLQELRAFKVKKELSGFELKQLGQLLQLRGSLRIYNLESVQDINEADEAELVHMNHLDTLILEWSWGTN
ncbi:hypothetical protein HU200_011119 [Digitaria exilis]|uniref:Uncharacterized protein n=1 Tax=Digitaria exilis TaxID=1010633 RepID=A0A835FIS8_9POAL|nr:hypothetical protein HU200_011119 [Digitaria exilis]